MSNSEKNELIITEQSYRYAGGYYAILTSDKKIIRFVMSDSDELAYHSVYFITIEEAISAYKSLLNGKNFHETEDTNDITYHVIKEFTDETFLDAFVEYLI